jgi:hypothetical protein
MEILAFIAACVVIWKLIDSASSKTENKDTVRQTTTIRQSGGKTTTETVIHQEFVRGTAHGSVNFQNTPADPTVGLSDADIVGIKTIPGSEAPTHKALNHDEAQPQQPYQATARLFGREPALQSPSKSYAEPKQPPERISTTQNTITTKRCTKCGKSQPAVTEFYRSSKQPDGFSVWCKTCHANRDKEDPRYKRCPKCKKRRLRTSFYKSDKNPDGLTKWCRYCLDKQR